jgi:hypothetical protein
MIDMESEELLTFAEAAKLIPSRHPGRRVSVTTIWRWATEEKFGLLMESLWAGGTRYTSREAIQRYCAAMTAARQKAALDSPKQRRLKQAKVEAELDAKGIGAPATRPKSSKPRKRRAVAK